MMKICWTALEGVERLDMLPKAWDYPIAPREY